MTTNTITAGGASDNFTTTAGNDGTLIVQVGPTGSKVNALSIDANGRVSMPQSVVAFSASKTGVQSIAASTFTKVTFQTKEFDTTNAFDNVTNNRFTPLVSGYYQINVAVNSSFTGTAPSIIETSLYKNGAAYKNVPHGEVSAGPYGGFALSTLVYMNGTTDFLEVFAWSNSASATLDGAFSATRNYFNGILLAKA